jgi:hypothetical protein
MIASTRSNPLRRTAALAVFLALSCILASPGSALAKKAHKKPTRPPAPLYWGAQVGDQLTGEAAPWDIGALSAFETLARKPVSISSFNQPFSECSNGRCKFINFPLTPLNNVREHGAIPFFSWSSSATPEGTNQRPFRLTRILRGSFDPFIREFAAAARDWGHPFFLRLNWEMNGFWFPWSEGVNGNRRGQFVRAWRHVHDIFEEVGAGNVTWVWCPNVDFTRKLIPLNTVYPGHRYVDWTCLDGFNWGKRPDSAGWQNFNQVFHETYKRVLRIAPKKPVLIGEVASNEVGGSKAAWIRHLLRIVPNKYRRIRALIWFDIRDRNTHWPIESSSKSRRAFAHWIQRSVYRPNEFGMIEQSPIMPPTWP